MHAAPPELPPPAAPTPPGKPGLNLGAALSFPFSDPAWPQACLMVGLALLLPVVGPLLHLGWQRRVFQRLRTGQPGLPPFDLMDDLSQGISPLLAVLNAVGPLLIAVLVVLLPGMVLMSFSTSGDGLHTIGLLFTVFGYLIAFVGSLLIWPLLPELLRRGFRGESLPLLRPGPSLAAMKAGGGDAVLAIFGLFVAQAVGGLGVALCWVGIFLTMPLGLAIGAHVLAQWDARVEALLGDGAGAPR